MKFTATRIFLALLVFASGFATADVIKSERDPRAFRTLTLDNELQVVLVSDPRLEKAAAAMTVQVGSNANPENREGLVHFLEHMLFLGTEKYPEPDAYQSFISSNGGSHNAFTAYESTTYFFDIALPSFEPAIDRFSQFFISPIFNPEYVDRERNAVHSEFEARRMDDGRRAYVADKLVMNPEHSWSAFSVGDLETLSNSEEDPIRDDLIEIFERYYSANLMTLALASPQSLDDLEQLVERYFSDIENTGAQAYQDSVPLYLIEQLPVQLDVKTIKATQNLRISFPLPPRRDHWRSKPLYFIADQIGYEGPGSLLSYLKSEGWADALGAWVGIDLPTESRLDISIDLTAEGMANYQDVVESVFAKIRLIEEQGLKPELYTEQKQLAEIDFLFSEPRDPSSEVTQLSQMLARYPADEILVAGYRFERFERDLIQALLAEMTPEKMILTLRSDQANTNKTEDKYGIEYRVSQLSDKDIDRWASPKTISALRIKEENPYIAENFDIKSAPEAKITPEPLADHSLVDVWHLQDSSFNQPRGSINVAFLSPFANQSAEDSVATALLARMINEQLNESLYDARMAGLSLSIYPHMKGLSMRVSGYNDRLLALLDASVTGLLAPLEDSDVFERIRDQYREEVLNSSKEAPYNQGFATLFESMLPIWSDQERLAVMDNISVERLEDQREKLFSEGQIRVLTHGNLTRSEAEESKKLLAERFEGKTGLREVLSPEPRQLEDTIAETIELQVDHNDSALLLYTQADNDSYQTRSEVSVLKEILAAPFYSSLRTDQQLGYIVFATYLPIAEQPGIGFVAQSPAASPAEIKEAYQAFLNDWRLKLQELNNDEIEQFKASVQSRLMTPPKRLSEQTSRLWRELDRDNFNFDTREKILEALTKISKSDLEARFDQLMKRKLWIFNEGLNQHSAEAH